MMSESDNICLVADRNLVHTIITVHNKNMIASCLSENLDHLFSDIDIVSTDKLSLYHSRIRHGTKDIKECSDNISIPVFAEHIDPIKPGSHTGWILPEAVKSVGAVGSLINHSEHRLNLADIDFCISRAKELDLDQIVCSNNILTSKAIATLSPNFLAVEPPELIGGDISVTTANPDIVSGSVNAVKDIDDDVKVLCGAGVKNGVDVARAIELGSVGVLLASGIIKSKNKEKIIRDLISEL